MSTRVSRTRKQATHKVTDTVGYSVPRTISENNLTSAGPPEFIENPASDSLAHLQKLWIRANSCHNEANRQHRSSPNRSTTAVCEYSRRACQKVETAIEIEQLAQTQPVSLNSYHSKQSALAANSAEKLLVKLETHTNKLA